MPQKKKEKKTNKKTNKKSYKKKRLNQNNKTIIYQSIPNYLSSQSAGHQNNKLIFNMDQPHNKNQELII